MLAQRERRRWAVALGVLALCGTASVAVTLLRPDLIAAQFLPEAVDPRLALTFVPADFLAYVAFPLLGAHGMWNGGQRTGRNLAVAAGLSTFPLAWALGATILDVMDVSGGRGILGPWAFQATFWPAMLLGAAETRWLMGTKRVGATR